MLDACYFPGNVRELENCIRRTATLSRGERIDGDDFACRHDECLSATLWKTAVSAPFPIVQPRSREESGGGQAEPPLPARPAAVADNEDDQLDNIKVSRAELLDALEATGWVQAKAARRLGLTPRQIGYALRRYAIALKRL